MENLPLEVLEHVLTFFLSEKLVHAEEGKRIDETTNMRHIRRHVDGSSIRAISLTCKILNTVVNSKSLWKFHSDKCSSALDASLAVSEMNDDGQMKPSLIGFRRIPLPDSVASFSKYKERVYAVEERSTGFSCALVVFGKGSSCSPIFIKEWYEHFAQFFNVPGSILKEHSYPTPCHFWGQSVWAYQYGGKSRRKDAWTDFVKAIFTQPPQVFENPDTFATPQHCADFIGRLQETKSFCGHPALRTFRRSWVECWPFMNVWAELVDWIVENAEALRQDERTIFQAASQLTQFIALWEDPTPHSMLRIDAGASLLLASKLNSTPLVESDICHCADNSPVIEAGVSATEAVSATEVVIFDTLRCRITLPTCMDFFVAFYRFLGWRKTSTKVYLCSFILELVLRGQLFHEYPATTLAGASILLTNFAFHARELWPRALARVTGKSLSDLAPYAVEISAFCERDRTTNSQFSRNMTRIRYGKSAKNFVSAMTIPLVDSVQILRDYGQTKKRKLHSLYSDAWCR